MQGDSEWFANRAGKVTGSCIKKVMSKGRGKKPSQTRLTYMYELVTERLTGKPKESVSAKSLEWGKDVEDFAREAYEIKTGNIVIEEDFINHPSIDFLGCSPDGLIGDEGGLEIKCPVNSSVHVETLKNGMPDDHKYQVQFNMWNTNRKWWDFASYDPRMPEHLQLYVERIYPDEEFISEMMPAIGLFLKETKELYNELNSQAA